jgi:hypothetical protein
VSALAEYNFNARFGGFGGRRAPWRQYSYQCDAVSNKSAMPNLSPAIQMDIGRAVSRIRSSNDLFVAIIFFRLFDGVHVRKRPNFPNMLRLLVGSSETSGPSSEFTESFRAFGEMNG